MERVVSAEEMRWCDETTIKVYGVPGMLLMETAGRGAVDVILQEYPDAAPGHVLVVCGKGNNGGDGLVIARLLSNFAAHVSVMLMVSVARLRGDAKTNFGILQKFQKKSQERISILRYSPRNLKALAAPDLVVDAIFGTGLSGSAPKPFVAMMEWIKRQAAPVIAVDIPSGVSGATGTVENCAVKADMTVTFGAIKSGLLCNRGRELSGSIRKVEIGTPRLLLQDARLRTSRIASSDVRTALPKRSMQAHKYSVGKVFVIAGSKGLTGAAALAAAAAMRSGAGAVVLGTPESVYPILAKKLTEIMVLPLPATDDGTLSAAAFDSIRKRLVWADVLVIGPGLSQNKETQETVVRILAEYAGRILLDADGLNAVAALGISKIRNSKAQIIMTPHVGEFSRLSGISMQEVERNRIEVARDFAGKTGATVVLKGVPTVTASKEGDAFLNSTGNPGMATAGSGDVLSGIIGGLWAQGMDGVAASWSGAFLHGLSGDHAADVLGRRGLLAHDLIENLPHAMQQVETGGAV